MTKGKCTSSFYPRTWFSKQVLALVRRCRRQPEKCEKLWKYLLNTIQQTISPVIISIIKILGWGCRGKWDNISACSEWKRLGTTQRCWAGGGCVGAHVRSTITPSHLLSLCYSCGSLLLQIRILAVYRAMGSYPDWILQTETWRIYPLISFFNPDIWNINFMIYLTAVMFMI